MHHGTRSAYQSGCRCLPCRAAEASYRQQLRLKHQRGLPILGQTISASEAWARIRVLRQEQFTDAQVMAYRNPRRRITWTARARIRLSTLLKLRALCQAYLIEDTELPTHTDDSPRL